MQRRGVLGGLFVLGAGTLGWAYGTIGGARASEHAPEGSTAEPIDPGSTVEGTLADGEELRYSIELAGGETLGVVFDSTFADWTDQRAEIGVYDPDGTVLDSTMVSTDQPIRTAIGTTVSETGTYAVRVASLAGSIPYSVTIDVADEDPNEPNDTRESAVEIAPDESVDGVVVGSEKDWFAFEVTAGEGIELELTARDLALNRDLRMAVFDPDGTEIGALPTDNPNRGAYRTDYEFLATVGLPPSTDPSVVGADVAEETGTHYVRVSEVGSDTLNGEIRGFSAYTLAVETVALDRFDPNERRETATQLEPDETIDGIIAGYDRDWYAFDAEEGEEIVIDYEFVDTTDGLLGTERELHGPTGEVVTDVFEPVVAPVSGTYALLVTPDGDTTARDFVAKETYRLTVTVSGNPTPTGRASVTLTDQSSDGTCIVVDGATLPEGGFVAIHDSQLTADDPSGSLRGVSPLLEAGTHGRIGVPLDEPLAETQRVWATLYRDTNETRTFDFATTAGDEDGPYTIEGLPVTADACITID
ncbi:hypothetical protein HAPAU_23850 [Halalkalicoccus paucihalophilus]|uniref:DUF7282 domain-containing protein n=1 Tax=Halalkalicoccus paucihalophilus TaxID=1008153 RepID=A0A151AEB8_9EURY|nr:hypothetical protein [Halalkalicoccus paucihalophilus]KYH25707.1 hypothetical protein HAPAU_23850 [Halalkalicoccus paucihalophilus]